MYDPLTKNLFGWCENPQPEVGSDGSSARFFFNQGVYEAMYKSSDKGGGRYCVPWGTYYDFSASVKALLVDGDPSGYYGLIFRASHQSYTAMMAFLLDPAGEYYIYASDNHGNAVPLTPLTQATGLNPNGDWNKVAVDAEGSVFTFFLNDVFQTQLTYDSGSTAKGSIGVDVGVNDPRRSIDVQFSDYEIREP